jgi:chromosome partitioning protein
MNRYVFSNVKGGTGKTNVIYQIAGCLGERGHKILCIDTDPQHNLSKAFLGKTPTQGLYELLQGKCALDKVIYQPYKNIKSLKNIYLLPCTYDLFFYLKGQATDLKNVLGDIHKNYDLVLIDTNPSINLITTNALVYGDKVVGVLDASTDAIDGFQYLEKNIINSVRESLNKTLEVSGMVLNSHDTRTNFSKLMTKTIDKLYGDKVFKTIITPSYRNKESRAAKLPLIEYDKRHPSTLQFQDLTIEFLKRAGVSK